MPHPQRLIPCRVMNHETKVHATTEDAKQQQPQISSDYVTHQHRCHMIDAHYWKLLCPTVRPVPFVGTPGVTMTGAPAATIVGRVPHRLAVSALLRSNEKVRIRYNNKGRGNQAVPTESLQSNAWIALKLQNVLVVEHLPVPLYIATGRLGLEFAVNRRNRHVRPTDFASRYRTHPFWKEGSVPEEDVSATPTAGVATPRTTFHTNNNERGPPDDVDPIAGCCKACGELHTLRFLADACYCEDCDPQRKRQQQPHRHQQQRPHRKKQHQRQRQQPKHGRHRTTKHKQPRRAAVPKKQPQPKKQPPKPVSLDAALPTARRPNPSFGATAASSSGMVAAFTGTTTTFSFGLPNPLSQPLADSR